MAHTLRALIAQKQVLEKLTTCFKSALLIPLKDPQFGLVPLSKEFLEELNDEGFDEFPKNLSIPEILVQELEICSKTTPIAYVQTEYFGGTGEQGVIVWHDGTIIYKAIESGAINQGLRHLAVKVGDSIDEFAALGLSTHRTTEAWIAKQS